MPGLLRHPGPPSSDSTRRADVQGRQHGRPGFPFVPLAFALSTADELDHLVHAPPFPP